MDEIITKEVIEVRQHLVNEIGNARNLTDNVSIHDVFLSAEGIIADLAFLIKPIADLEQIYRSEVVTQMMDNEISHAKAEQIAKAGNTYKEWIKMKRLTDLADEQIKILKKFRDDLNKEWART